MSREESEAPAGQADAPGATGTTVITPLAPAEILARLDHAARRGRMPGFVPEPGEGVLFTLELHGSPFDGILTAAARKREDGKTEVECESRMQWMMPAIFAVVLIATVWPGVYFMDRFLPDWEWIPRVGTWWPTTWWWYIPLTALPLPLAWRALMLRSRAALVKERSKAVEKVANEIEGQISDR